VLRGFLLGLLVGVVLSGTAVAGFVLGKNSVRSRHIAPGAVRSSDIANGRRGVRSVDVRDGAIDGRDLATGGVSAIDIADGGVGAAEISDGAVGSSEIGDGQVGAAEIGADRIGAEKLAGVTTLAATQRVLLAEGESVDLAQNGSLTLRGICQDVGATEAQVRLLSAVNGTKLDIAGGGAIEPPVFGARKDEDLEVVDAGVPHTLFATAGTLPGNGFYLSAYYTAFAPDGSALHGFVAGAANVQVNDRCVFVASGLA
jgi:hypothetical protein